MTLVTGPCKIAILQGQILAMHSSVAVGLLTWKGSAVVFDIKGDLYKQTAGYRNTLGDVFRFDTRGNGNAYDPLNEKHAEDELYAIAKHLMYERNEGEGKAFTQKGTKILTLLWLACLELNRITGKQYRLLPFVGQMADLGINSAASIVNDISPAIARRLLEGEFNPEYNYKEDKYLASSWESFTARLYPLLTERILRCFNGSDFTARDIIAGKEPVTVYLCIPEKDLLAKAPVIRLVMESLMSEMKDYFDDAPGDSAIEKGGFDHRIGHFRPLRIIGTTPNSSALNGLGASTWDRSRWGGRRHDQGQKGCREVLYILDEAGNIEREH
jgi:type IV secretory pathway TraG/TraD family ATPase VirD4